VPAAAVSPRYSPNRRGKTASTSLRQSIRHTRSGRGVPDVAADADPYSGVVVMHINGKQLEPIGGTSAATPLWASLIARLNQGLNARCGFINPTLYTKCEHGVLNDITTGNNGAYAAGPGWDACTGLGTPQGQNLLKALSTAPTVASRKVAAHV